MDKPTHYIIPAEVLSGLIQYLAGRPYAEVAAGMAQLQQLQSAPVAEPPAAPKKASS